MAENFGYLDSWFRENRFAFGIVPNGCPSHMCKGGYRYWQGSYYHHPLFRGC
ncbi:hypothetical protein MFP26_03940 [Brenneria sp. MC1SB4.1]|uniref:Uncharacterized protein n=1 Tax=Brenneria tiliae TaxID=2914984 RepID=A0ABT0MPU5_9GAMM|nr:hypothetical protein [Brenneria tiliae]MCL2891851.1 hypothetical protein [Brenneria tiliae]